MALLNFASRSDCNRDFIADDASVASTTAIDMRCPVFNTALTEARLRALVDRRDCDLLSSTIDVSVGKSGGICSSGKDSSVMPTLAASDVCRRFPTSCVLRCLYSLRLAAVGPAPALSLWCRMICICSSTSMTAPFFSCKRPSNKAVLASGGAASAPRSDSPSPLSEPLPSGSGRTGPWPPLGDASGLDGVGANPNFFKAAAPWFPVGMVDRPFGDLGVMGVTGVRAPCITLFVSSCSSLDCSAARRSLALKPPSVAHCSFSGASGNWCSIGCRKCA
mmetsp:Transcript_14227/g.40436  ORF Transcript_14227/g.40436 Transcript_14227/m.40436 type:complete len:277 (+) Transcript_14227:848-1678(+)